MPGTFNIDLSEGYKVVSYPYPMVAFSTSATPDVWTAYQVAINAAAISSDFYIVGVSLYNYASASYEIEVATGGAGAEVAIATICSYGGSAGTPYICPMDPIRVLADTRVSIRCRDDGASSKSVRAGLLIKEVV